MAKIIEIISHTQYLTLFETIHKIQHKNKTRHHFSGGNFIQI